MTPVLTVGEILSAQARLQPDRTGARDLEWTTTFRRWNERACRLANGLIGLCLAKGGRIAVLAFNRLKWAEIYIAIAKAVFIVSNNAAWNIERYDQEVKYGGRVVGTTLRHADYAGMARALGAHGERVEDPSDLVDAIRRGLDNAPAVIDVVTSQDAVSSDAKKGLGFVPDYQPLTAWDDAERKRRGEVSA